MYVLVLYIDRPPYYLFATLDEDDKVRYTPHLGGALTFRNEDQAYGFDPDLHAMPIEDARELSKVVSK